VGKENMNRHCQQQINRLESIIKSNQRNFHSVGKALKAIRDNHFHCNLGFDSFESYAKNRWDIGKSHAYRLIDAAQVVENLSPIGDIVPLNEAQCRLLAPFESLQQRQIWREFLKLGVALTARQLRNFISGYTGQRNTPRYDRIETISDCYQKAVFEILYQIRVARSENWQSTSRQAAIYWNNVMKAKILWEKS
jgi:hypothetical protein